MNDPAGLSTFQGLHHLFYQRDPSGVFLGDIRWGHATSPDLVHWIDQPDALGRDDALGVPFTGSAVVAPPGTVCADECLALVFTHAMGAAGQQQSLATSVDGQTFALWAQNPVLPSIGEADFRDPTVRWDAEAARWRMIVGARNRALFYSSPDLVTWTATGQFAAPDVPAGAWECPDLFPLEAPGGGTRWVLKTDVSPGLLQAGTSRYWLGTFDGQTFTADTPGAGLRFDGPDFYAAQTFSQPIDGQTVWLGWLNSWAYAMSVPGEAWRGAQSVPRTLSLVETTGGLRLAQRPLAALAKDPCALVEADSATGPLLDDAGVGVWIDAVLSPGAALDVLADDTVHTRVGLDADGQLYVDRTSSGGEVPAAFLARHAVPAGAAGQPLTVTVIVDRTSVEVFTADGVTVLTTSVYPPEGARRISVAAGEARDVRIRPLEAVMPGRR